MKNKNDQMNEDLRREAEEKNLSLARFPEENPNPILRVAHDGTLLYVNKAGASQLPEWQLQTGRRIISNRLREVVARTVENKTIEVIEIEYDKQLYSFSVVPVPNTGYINLYGSDITEQKQAEENLRQNEARYHNILDSMMEGCQIIGFDWRYIYINDTATEQNRRPKEELLSRRYMDVWPGVEATEVFKAIQNCMEERISHTMETKFIFPDGGNGWYKLVIQPITEGIFILSIDITESKRAEEKLLHYTNRLEHAETQAQLGSWEFDPQTGTGWWSKQMYELLGFKYSENVPNTEDYLEHIHPNDRLIVQGALTRMAQGQEPSSLAYRNNPIYGRLHYFAPTTYIEKDMHGKLIKFTGTLLDITERKQREEELLERERKLSTIFNLLPVGISILDQDRKISFVNKTLEKILGITHEGLLRRDYRDRAYLRSDGSVMPAEEFASVRAIKEQKIISNIETGVVKEDGSISWTNVSAVPVDFQDWKAVIVTTDVTERKQTEEALRIKDQAVHASLNAIAIGDLSGKLTYVNPAFLNLWGYTHESEVLGRSVLQFWNTEEKAAEILPALQSQPGWVGEMTTKRKDGSPLYVHLSANLLKDKHGQPAGMVAAFVDLTERKRNEEELRESNLRFTQLADSIPEVFWMFDIKTQKLIYVSPAYEAIWGHTCAELYQNPNNYIESILPEDQPPMQVALEEQSNGKQTELEYRIKHPDGTIRWIWDRSFPSFDESGKLISTIGLATNVTEIKLREISIHEKAEDLTLINHLNEAINRGDSLAEITTFLGQETRRLFKTLGASLYLISEDGKILNMPVVNLDQTFIAKVEKLIGVPMPVIKIPIKPNGTFAKLINNPQGTIMTDAQEIQRWMTEFTETETLPTVVKLVAVKFIPQIYKLLSLQSIISLPLKLADNTLGMLEISSTYLLGQHELERLRMISNQLTAAILRKQNEQKLRESNQRFEQLANHINEAFWITDSERKSEVYLSPATAVIWGQPIEMLMQPDAFLTHVLSTDQNTVKSALRKQARGEKTSVEYRIQRPDGTIRWIWDRSFPIFDEYGKLTGTAGVSTDITQIKETQQQLEIFNHNLEARVIERTAEVQDLYDKAPVGYHSLDANGTFIMINQTELNWLGYTRAEIVGRKTFLDLITPQSQQIFQENFPRFKARDWIKNLEFELIRKDGSIFPVLFNATAVYDADGNFLQSRSTMSDITERMNAEKAVRESQASLQNFLDTATDLIQRLDQNGHYLYVNPSWCESLGYTPEEAYQKTMFDVIAPEYHDHCLSVLKTLETTGQPQDFEVVFKTKDGKSVVAEGGVSIHIDANEKITTNGIFRDITQRKQAEESLQESRNQLHTANISLEKAARLKDEFLASTSHELRTPLTGILGFSEALQLKVYGDLSEKQSKIISLIEESGQHLLELINDILDLSKISAGKMDIILAPCSLADVCQASLQLTKGMAQQKNQQVHYTPATEPVLMLADARRLKQILVNLLSNAIKFTPENGELGLEVQANKSERNIQLTVWDKGIGIKEEDMHKLFTPFIQIDSSLARQYAGTGLGLSLVGPLVKMHNGSIKAESVFSEGSRFIITLPWAPENSMPLPATSQRTATGNTGTLTLPEETRAPVIFLVDDNEVVLRAITDYLESKHYHVIQARNGVEALEQIEKLQPDLILMDIQMPGMNGLEATRRIRAHKNPQIAATPIIAVTALAMPDDRENCLRAGVNEYLSKPIKLRSLAALIQDLIKNAGPK